MPTERSRRKGTASEKKQLPQHRKGAVLKIMAYKRKYRPGEVITSLDELSKQECIYIHHKIYHCGFWGSMQFRQLKTYIERGWIRKAEGVDPKNENT